MPRKRYVDGTFAVDRGEQFAVNVVRLPFMPLDDPGFDWTVRQIQTVAGRAANRSPAQGLSAIAALRYHAERLERYAVINARRLGWSWREIGESLGVSKQVLHKRYARLVPQLR